MNRRIAVVVVLAASAAAALPSLAHAEGSDPHAKAKFDVIQSSGKKATMKVRYQCASGKALWVSAKQSKSGAKDTKLTKEGSSKKAAAWLESHRNKYVCDGKSHLTTVSIDTVEKGSKGSLRPGVAWVQFCVTKGKDLVLSQSAWVKVV